MEPKIRKQHRATEQLSPETGWACRAATREATTAYKDEIYMTTITYRPAEILHWFGIKSQQEKTAAKRHGQAAIESSDLVRSFKNVAGAAASFGKGALTDLVQKQAEETVFHLGEDAFEILGMTSRKKIIYSQVRQISARPHDRFEIDHSGGTLVIKPSAHLVAGRLRVPVGWLRNGLEVPYGMLIEEIAARCGVDIIAE